MASKERRSLSAIRKNAEALQNTVQVGVHKGANTPSHEPPVPSSCISHTTDRNPQSPASTSPIHPISPHPSVTPSTSSLRPEPLPLIEATASKQLLQIELPKAFIVAQEALDAHWASISSLIAARHDELQAQLDWARQEWVTRARPVLSTTSSSSSLFPPSIQFGVSVRLHHMFNTTVENFTFKSLLF